MGLAKKAGRNPRQVAEQIIAHLDLGEIAAEPPSIAGPGFINVRLSAGWLAKLLGQAAATEHIGVARVSAPQTVVVDYSGPNIAKELHVGHLRSTIIGDAVVRVLDFQGQRVIRQNHIGDWGTQFGRVILAIWHLCMSKTRHNDPTYPQRMAEYLLAARKSNDIAARSQIVAQVAARQQEDYQADPDGTAIFEPFLESYKADLEELLPSYQFVSALEDTPEAAAAVIQGKLGNTRALATLSKMVTSDLQKGIAANPLNRQEEKAWRKVREATMEACQQIYDQLNVLLTREDEYGESRYNAMLPSIVEDLKKLGLAEESQGAIAVFIDGPEKPPVLIEKAGGEGFLYATTDLAAHSLSSNVPAGAANHLPGGCAAGPSL